MEAYVDKEGNTRYRRINRNRNDLDISNDDKSNRNNIDLVNRINNNSNNNVINSISINNSEINNTNIVNNTINSVNNINNNNQNTNINTTSHINNNQKSNLTNITDNNNNLQLYNTTNENIRININLPYQPKMQRPQNPPNTAKKEDPSAEEEMLRMPEDEREAYKKKILGIASEPSKIQRSLGSRISDFLKEHKEGIFAAVDVIGTLCLSRPSILRTFGRVKKAVTNGYEYFSKEGIENGFKKWWNKSQQEHANDLINNYPELKSKDKDIATILKFLPKTTVKQAKENQNKSSAHCVICLCDFEIGESISALPCFHVFHTQCIENWLQQAPHCPVCKFEVTLTNLLGQV